MSLPARVPSLESQASFGLHRSAPRRIAPQDLDATLPLAPLPVPEPREVLGMKCLYCQAPVERGTAEVRVNRHGYQMTWQKVPAWVCTRCEQPYFEPQEVETVRSAVTSMKRLGH